MKLLFAFLLTTYAQVKDVSVSEFNHYSASRMADYLHVATQEYGYNGCYDDSTYKQIQSYLDTPQNGRKYGNLVYDFALVEIAAAKSRKPEEISVKGLLRTLLTSKFGQPRCKP